MSKVVVASHNARKAKLELALQGFEYPKDVVVRMGGVLKYPEFPIQINSVKAVANCINKLKTKQLLVEAGVETLPFETAPVYDYPFIVKGVQRSRGNAVFVAENKEEFNVMAKILMQRSGGYYVEPFFKTTSEYRIHCTPDEVFFFVKKIKETEDFIYTCNNHHNVQDFVKPRRWKEMQQHAMNAVKALGLEIGAVDIGYCSLTNPHTFCVHEVNTSPELLKHTFDAYVAQIDKLIKAKL